MNRQHSMLEPFWRPFPVEKGGWMEEIGLVRVCLGGGESGLLGKGEMEGIER